MVFEFSGFVTDALVMASCDDMVEMCMAIWDVIGIVNCMIEGAKNPGWH